MIMEGELRKVLREYRLIYVHLTITGMGGGEFEPMIPHWKEVVKMIGPLVDLVGGPLRISLKVEGDGKAYSNFDLFPALADAIAPFGIKICRVSWVSPYKKVLIRLGQKGWRLIPQIHDEKISQAGQLADFAQRHGMDIHFCSMEGFPVSRCIDGEFLSKIHPDGLACSKEKAKGQRELCGCTHSIDIGWYSLQCKHGCLYCYARP
jgi:hypothetical protein